MNKKTRAAYDKLQSTKDNLNKKKSCHVCKNLTRKKCGGCNNIFYCSKECQRTDWKEHKKICKKKSSYIFNGFHTILSDNLNEQSEITEMVKNCGGKTHFLFGNIQKIIDNLKPMTEEEIKKLYEKGTCDDYYFNSEICQYICYENKDGRIRHYCFSPIDKENYENEYKRLREGVKGFHELGFYIYGVDFKTIIN